MTKPYWFKVVPNGSGGKQILVLDEKMVQEACREKSTAALPRWQFGLALSVFRNICTELGIKIESRDAPRR